MNDADARTICSLFALGELSGPPLEVGGGLTNRVWRFATSHGAFAVKEMTRDPARADYVEWSDRAFSLEVAAFGAGIPMPRPVPVAATGRCLAELRGADMSMITARAHEWVDGEKLDNSVAYPGEIAARVAVLLARIHALGMRSSATAAEALRVFGNEHWSGLAGRADRAGLEWSEALHGLLPTLHELERYLSVAHRDRTPLLVSHRDADAKNVLRTPTRELVLVDWDQAGPVNPRHDLANHALVWAGVHRGDPDPAIVRAFVAAYRGEAGSSGPFRHTDLAELVALRLGWLDFNVSRALGERMRGESDRDAGVRVIRRNVDQLPRFARSLDAWLQVLGE